MRQIEPLYADSHSISEISGVGVVKFVLGVVVYPVATSTFVKSRSLEVLEAIAHKRDRPHLVCLVGLLKSLLSHMTLSGNQLAAC